MGVNVYLEITCLKSSEAFCVLYVLNLQDFVAKATKAQKLRTCSASAYDGCHSDGANLPLQSYFG